MRRMKGEGSIFFDNTRKRFVFQGWYRTFSGDRKRKTLMASNRKALEQRIQEWKATLTEGRELFSATLTVHQVAQVWLNATRNSIKEATMRLYSSNMNSHILPVFGARKPDSVTAVEVQYWLNSLLGKGLSPRTCNIIRATWYTCFEWALGQGLIRKNPLRGVRALRDDPKPIRALNREELDKLLTVAKEGAYYPFLDNDFGEYVQREVYVAVVLAARTGMRRGEVFGLQWSNIDFQRGTIHVVNNLSPSRKLSTPKTMNSTRNVLLDPDTLALLVWWKTYQQQYMRSYSVIVRHEKHLVFTSMTGSPVGLDNFRCRQWKALTQAAGLSGLGFHSLRHTHATLLIAAGVPIKVVSERLGHKSVALTMRVYVNVLPTMQQMAVEAILAMNKKEAPKGAGTPRKAKGND